jgi:hypothetical protein
MDTGAFAFLACERRKDLLNIRQQGRLILLDNQQVIPARLDHLRAQPLLTI